MLMTAGAACTGTSDRFLTDADLIFGVGASFSANTYSYPLPSGTPMIQITTDERDLNKNFPAHYPIMCDAKLVLRQFIDAAKDLLGGKPRTSPSKPATPGAQKPKGSGNPKPKK